MQDKGKAHNNVKGDVSQPYRDKASLGTGLRRDHRMWAALAGVLVLVWPDIGGGTVVAQRFLGIGLGLLTALLTAFALIMVRSLTRTESPGAIAFYFVVASMAGGILTLPWGWAFPDAQTVLLLVLAGLFGGFAHIAMTLSFSYTEASRLAPF